MHHRDRENCSTQRQLSESVALDSRLSVHGATGRCWSIPHKKREECLGVWLRVKILNSLVFNLRTTVRATRSLRDAAAPANHWNCAFASFHGLLTSIGLGFLIFR
jgi:hypothetical protein